MGRAVAGTSSREGQIAWRRSPARRRYAGFQYRCWKRPYVMRAVEWFEERAAIMEFDGGMVRHDAEYAAFALALAYCRRRGLRLPYEGYFYVHRLGNADLVWSDEDCRPHYITRRPDWIPS